jgi:hypothetical protein
MNTQLPERPCDLVRAEVIDELAAHVQCRLGSNVRNFRIVAVGDGLVLKGWSRTYYAKQIAQHAVLKATDLPILANEIEVV